MRISLTKILFIILIWTILLLIIEFLVPFTAVRTILGIPFVLFMPGFVLISILLPKNDDMSITQRIVLSFVASILVDTVIGLILNYTSFGITSHSVLLTITFFVMVMGVAGLLFQSLIPINKRVFLDFQIRLSNPISGVLNISLLSLMGLVIIGAIGTVTYFSIAPKSEGKFTQFYIVNEGGKLYSRDTASNNENVLITICIVNNEESQIDYRLLTQVNNENYKEIDNIILDNREKWQQQLLLPADTRTQTKIEFLLFKNNESTPYLESLRVWIEPSELNIALK